MRGQTGLLVIAAGVVLAVLGGRAAASVIVYTNSTFDDSGTGFGTVLSLLSLQDVGGGQPDTKESGSVLRNAAGTADVLSGEAQPGPQNSTRTVAELTAHGINATNLALSLNIVETPPPAGGLGSLVVHDFVARFYTNPADLTQFFDATYTAPAGGQLLMVAGNGQGLAGQLFRVDLTPAEATAFFSNPNNRIGMIVDPTQAFTDVSSGPDSFYVAPEPACLALLAGLPWLHARRRTRRI
jgi:hypothetical protein